jgi:putative PEP-CTERM system histidine kinase
MAVGAYIITASLLARWAGEKSRLDIPMESVIFLLSLVILAAALLGTTFRQRAKLWIRRHVLAGRYDYRRYWLEVTERIRAIDTPQDLANSLAEIVQKALGAVEVTVWSRLRNPNRLCLLSSRGLHSDGLQQEVRGVVEHLFDLTEPLAVGKDDRNSWPAEVSSFIEQTHASLIVPLVSDGKTVGILAVGSDRSGREFDWEALEFLGVLGRHAAGELHKAELRSTLLEAKELEAFRTFSTFLMHDLKNYASTLSIMAKSSARHSGNPEFQRDSFQAVFEIAGHMKRLCAGLRTFSSGLAADKKLQDLNEITRQAADSLFDGISNRLVLDLGDVPPLWLDADEVSRVLHNLIVNAQEASASGGVITLRTKCLADAVELWVEDNGSGMSREFVQRELFHPFHTTKSDGLGIGLFQTRKIVEAHKGTIQVESEEGKGTKVRVVFPIPPRAPEPQPEIAIKVGQ